MILVRKVENGVAQYNHQLFMFVYEDSGKRLILNLDDDAISRPLPKLRLSCPEWFRVMADNQGCVLPLLSPLFFVLSVAHRTILRVKSVRS